MTQIKSELLG
jgi:hypothetical protein